MKINRPIFSGWLRSCFEHARTIMLYHAGALLLALLVGITMIGPNVAFMNSPEYRGLPIVFIDNDYSYYLTRMHAAYDGCHFTCNPYIKESGTHYPFFDPSLSIPLLALPGILFDIPVVTLKLIYDFLLPSIFFLLCYSLLYRLTKRKLLSAGGALAIVFGHIIVNTTALVDIRAILSTLTANTGFHDFLLYTRPINPQFSSIIFFLFLHALLSTLQKPSFKKYGALALLYGFSFYVYFYTYTFLTVVLGTSALVLLFLNRRFEAVRMGGALGLGILLGSPSLYQLYSVLTHETALGIHKDGGEVTGRISTHVPFVTMSGIALLFASISLGVRYYHSNRTRISVEALFGGILIASGFIIGNQHVISGVVVQYFHYQWYYLTPVFVVVATLAISLFLPKGMRFSRVIGSVCIGFFFLHAFVVQYESYTYRKSPTADMQSKYEVLSWFSKNVPKGAVIMASEKLSQLVGVYTNNYIVWGPVAHVYLRDQHDTRPEDFYGALKSEQALARVLKVYGVDYVITDSHRFIEQSHLKEGTGTVRFKTDDFMVIQTR